ncbi:DNA-directed RNA polymerase subunit alpha [Patescibacteria group bacterium]|nr:DNA-directed RNA polymerase subunit alpha [Patescibacteria group bacterium]MCL5091697.1 DNA-directed RNA polymerase subunit alpha [Patescibacteria group bacterium]
MIEPAFFTKTVELGDHDTRFTLEPLLPSFGQTYGNALRRTLISTIKGAAVSYIRVKGAPHLFSTIKGVKESVLEIVLNLKQLRFEIPADGQYEIHLEVKGAKKITGKDFTGEIKVVNQDLVVAETTDAKAKLEIDLIVETGYGYAASEEKEAKTDYIAVDSFFSPVKKVNFKVESARVGRKTNYDRLILEIATDGSIAPEDALRNAANILAKHFAHVLSGKDQPQEENSAIQEQSKQRVEADKRLYEVIIDELNLPSRVVNALLRENIETVADLIKAGRDKLIDLKGLGKKSIVLIDEELKKIGVEFK